MWTATYRSLRPGEPVPPGEPRRYLSDSRGYVRLRWKVGTGQYVETYEHRLVAGVPAADVHHTNHAKADNAPGNLHPLSKAEHARVHMDSLIAARRAKPVRYGTRAQIRAAKAARIAARAAARAALLAEITRRYEAGDSLQEIGTALGRHPSNIGRALRGHSCT